VIGAGPVLKVGLYESGVASTAVACTIHQAVLGEGLRWDARRNAVLAVDVLVGRLYRGRVADDGDLILTRS
jgi:hypothetical protein